MKELTFAFAILFLTSSTTMAQQSDVSDLITVSQELLYAVRVGDSTKFLIQELEQAERQQLLEDVESDAEKMVFWINIYNAYTILKIQADPESYEKKKSFFSNRDIVITDHVFSLNDIEHGILRKSKVWWSLGYLNKLVPDEAEKQLRVENMDVRLHFALNCGAKSCPAIAFYDVKNLNQQLELASKVFLQGETVFDLEENTATTSRILQWYKADFNGKKGIQALLSRYGAIPKNANPKIKFSKYDWTVNLQNYAN